MVAITVADCPSPASFGDQLEPLKGRFYGVPGRMRGGRRIGGQAGIITNIDPFVSPQAVGGTDRAGISFPVLGAEARIQPIFPASAPNPVDGNPMGHSFPVRLTSSPVVDKPWDPSAVRQTGFPDGRASHRPQVAGRDVSRAGQTGGQGRKEGFQQTGSNQFRPGMIKGGASMSPNDGTVRVSVCPSPSVAEDFWLDRLHILPVSAEQTNLGNVVNDVDTTFEVFNASATVAAVINLLQELNTVGFTVISGRTPPSPELTIPPYGSESYTIRAEAETGPPVIDATFTWIPSAPFNSVDVNFIGNRITIFTFEPQFNVETEFNWLTSIVEAYDGTEQRMQMRDRPRQSILYRFRKGDAFLDDEEPYPEEPSAMEHVMFDSLGRVFAVPVWEDRTVLNAPVAVNDTVISITTAGLDFQPGQLLLLWRDWNDTEAQEITSVAAGSITATNPFLQAWAVEDTVVLPTFTAYVDDAVTQLIHRLDHVLWTIRFNRINERNDLLDGVSPELPSDFMGLPIWPRKWTISGVNQNRIWRRNIQEVQTALGEIERTFRNTVPRRANAQLQVNIRGRTDFETFRQFVLALRGRQKIFWLGSKYHQFRIQAVTPALGGSIRVFNNFYTNFVATRAIFNIINVVLTDGTENRHTIISAVDVGTPPNNETDLGISPVAPVQYDTTNVARIEYYTRHRLDTDKVVFQAIKPRDHYTLTFPIIEVLNET